MTTAAEAVGASIDVTFGSVLMRMSPIDDAAIGEFERWVQSRIVTLAKASLDDLTEDERTTVLAKVIARAATVDMMSPEYARAMTTFEGAAKLLELSFRKHNSKITAAEVLVMIKENPDALGDAMVKYDLLNDGADNKTTVRKKKRVTKRKTVRKKNRR